MIRTLLVHSLLTIGLSEFQLRQAQAQAVWKPVEIPRSLPSPPIWNRTVSDSEEPDESPASWEVVPEPGDHNQYPSKVIWKVLRVKMRLRFPSNSVITLPSSFEEVEALLNIIPFKPSDYQPLRDYRL